MLYMLRTVAVAIQQPDVWYRHVQNCEVQLIKVAPDDGLIQSETYRAYIENKV